MTETPFTLLQDNYCTIKMILNLLLSQCNFEAWNVMINYNCHAQHQGLLVATAYKNSPCHVLSCHVAQKWILFLLSFSSDLIKTKPLKHLSFSSSQIGLRELHLLMIVTKLMEWAWAETLKHSKTQQVGTSEWLLVSLLQGVRVTHPPIYTNLHPTCAFSLLSLPHQPTGLPVEMALI